MSGRPKLLILITELVMGGAARVVRDHARAFSARYDVHDAVFDPRYGMDFADGSPPVSLDEGHVSRGPFRPLLNLLRRVRRLRKVKRELGVDICISHLEGAHYVDVLSRQGEKTVLCVHGSVLHNRMIRGPLGWLRKRVLIPRLYNRADRIVTVSRDIIPELTALRVDARKIRAIPNFFDVDAIDRAAAEPLSADEKAIFAAVPVIVATGRLHEQKHPLVMLDVFADVRRHRECRLLWLGDGPLLPAMNARATRLGLTVTETASEEADVYLLGKRANPFNLTKSSTMFVLPSLWEGFPMSLCEAMACGTPVVSADCPTGPSEILGGFGAGLLLPMLDNAEARARWAQEIVALLDDQARRKRFSKAGKVRVRDFTPEKVGPQWQALFAELLAEDE